MADEVTDQERQCEDCGTTLEVEYDSLCLDCSTFICERCGRDLPPDEQGLCGNCEDDE